MFSMIIHSLLYKYGVEFFEEFSHWAIFCPWVANIINVALNPSMSTFI